MDDPFIRKLGKHYVHNSSGTSFMVFWNKRIKSLHDFDSHSDAHWNSSPDSTIGNPYIYLVRTLKKIYLIKKFLKKCAFCSLVDKDLDKTLSISKNCLVFLFLPFWPRVLSRCGPKKGYNGITGFDNVAFVLMEQMAFKIWVNGTIFL